MRRKYTNFLCDVNIFLGISKIFFIVNECRVFIMILLEKIFMLVFNDKIQKDVIFANEL